MHRPRLAASKITGVNRKNPSSMTQIIRNPSIWSTYQQSPTCHLSFVWLIDHLFVPRSHRTLANSLARLHADCLDGEPPGLLKDFQMISVFKTSVGWVLFWGIIPTIFLGGWSEFHCGNPGEPTNGMIEWSIEHQHWPIHGANQHANWDLSKPWALSHVDRGCVDA